MDKHLFNSTFIEQQLQKASYNASLGISVNRLATMDVSGKNITLIVIKLDAGKQLIPHLHENDGEICIPISEGILTLGKAVRDKKGKYRLNKKGKIIVEWGTPQEIIPGKPIEITPGIPHHLYAHTKNPVIVLFLLPVTHLEADKKFVTDPQISKKYIR